MRRRGSLPLAAAALAAGLLSAGSVARAEAPAPTPGAGPAEPPKCADCHEEQVKTFAGNPHARYSHRDKKPDPNEICATCHGDGAKHIQEGGDPKFIQSFDGVAGAELCLSCHEKSDEHASFSTGFHANSAAVNCLSCHAIHGAVRSSEQLLAKTPGQLCQSCHTGISAALRSKPYVHRLDRGGMTCLDCHDPHDRKGRSVKLTREGELACLECHAEKRGPFVFDHVTGSAGDCLSCHESHGSNNPKMLQWARVDKLCLSCHSQTGGPPTAGGQPPSFHDLTLPRYRNCTTCHVAVHGSNLSPMLLK
ncbi:MAG: DmsE family decaheme c-type cytochrome [Thermoanaerobaculia bacterium]